MHKLLTIQNADAMKWSQDLAAKEGIFVGITSGATFAGALAIAKEAPKGANILAMLPDNIASVEPRSNSWNDWKTRLRASVRAALRAVTAVMAAFSMSSEVLYWWAHASIRGARR